MLINPLKDYLNCEWGVVHKQVKVTDINKCHELKYCSRKMT